MLSIYTTKLQFLYNIYTQLVCVGRSGVNSSRGSQVMGGCWVLGAGKSGLSGPYNDIHAQLQMPPTSLALAAAI